MLVNVPAIKSGLRMLKKNTKSLTVVLHLDFHIQLSHICSMTFVQLRMDSDMFLCCSVAGGEHRGAPAVLHDPWRRLLLLRFHVASGNATQRHRLLLWTSSSLRHGELFLSNISHTVFYVNLPPCLSFHDISLIACVDVAVHCWHLHEHRRRADLDPGCQHLGQRPL